MRNAACFDIGGTSIKYGVIDENGAILFKGMYPSPKNNCKENIPQTMKQKIEELKKEYSIDVIGVSTAGQVDSDKGEIVFASDNLPQYTGTKLSYMVKKLTGIECFIENDVNAAALGELWKGAGQGKKNFVCLTLGTGIGGALIIDGRLYKGVSGGAGEIGHTIINENGYKCNCGGKGCYERYASTSALVRAYASEKNIDYKETNGKKIMDKVKSKETAAVKVYDEFLNHIVTGLVNVTHILDPGLIIIGGGISAQGKPFFDEINNRFKEAVMPSYSAYTKIVQAELLNDAGLIGACYLAFVRAQITDNIVQRR